MDQGQQSPNKKISLNPVPEIRNHVVENEVLGGESNPTQETSDTPDYIIEDLKFLRARLPLTTPKRSVVPKRRFEDESIFDEKMKQAREDDVLISEILGCYWQNNFSEQNTSSKVSVSTNSNTVAAESEPTKLKMLVLDTILNYLSTMEVSRPLTASNMSSLHINIRYFAEQYTKTLVDSENSSLLSEENLNLEPQVSSENNECKNPCENTLENCKKYKIKNRSTDDGKRNMISDFLNLICPCCEEYIRNYSKACKTSKQIISAESTSNVIYIERSSNTLLEELEVKLNEYTSEDSGKRSTNCSDICETSKINRRPQREFVSVKSGPSDVLMNKRKGKRNERSGSRTSIKDIETASKSIKTQRRNSLFDQPEDEIIKRNDVKLSSNDGKCYPCEKILKNYADISEISEVFKRPQPESENINSGTSDVLMTKRKGKRNEISSSGTSIKDLEAAFKSLRTSRRNALLVDSEEEIIEINCAKPSSSKCDPCEKTSKQNSDIRETSEVFKSPQRESENIKSGTSDVLMNKRKGKTNTKSSSGTSIKDLEAASKTIRTERRLVDSEKEIIERNYAKPSSSKCNPCEKTLKQNSDIRETSKIFERPQHESENIKSGTSDVLMNKRKGKRNERSSSETSIKDLETASKIMKTERSNSLCHPCGKTLKNDLDIRETSEVFKRPQRESENIKSGTSDVLMNKRKGRRNKTSSSGTSMKDIDAASKNIKTEKSNKPEDEIIRRNEMKLSSIDSKCYPCEKTLNTLYSFKSPQRESENVKSGTNIVQICKCKDKSNKRSDSSVKDTDSKSKSNNNSLDEVIERNDTKFTSNNSECYPSEEALKNVSDISEISKVKRRTSNVEMNKRKGKRNKRSDSGTSIYVEVASKSVQTERNNSKFDEMDNEITEGNDKKNSSNNSIYYLCKETLKNDSETSKAKMNNHSRISSKDFEVKYKGIKNERSNHLLNESEDKVNSDDTQCHPCKDTSKNCSDNCKTKEECNNRLHGSENLKIDETNQTNKTKVEKNRKSYALDKNGEYMKLVNRKKSN